MSKTKTPDEIQALKDNWLKDPCWDIYSTEGFEAHYEELLAFQMEQMLEWENASREKVEARALLIREQTGVADKDIGPALYTWSEIEEATRINLKYTDDPNANMTAILIRATLLQAAQLKRIADALESMDDGDSLIRSAAIWGSGE